jgi:hypothetical protein
MRTEERLFHPKTLRSQDVELLGEGELRTAGILRLSFPYHVNHLDATQDRPSGCHRLESEHRSNPPLNSAMILLDAVIQVTALPDPNRLQFAS